MHELIGKVCVITGACARTGRVAAEVWAAEGAVLVLVDPHPAKLKSLAEVVRQRGGEVHAVPGDVTVEADVQRLVAFLEALAGRVDVLLHNACERYDQPSLSGVDVDLGESVLPVIGAALECTTRLLTPLLGIRPGGQVLYTTGGMHALTYQPAQVALLGILATTTRMLAENLAPVRVNLFDPGWTRATGAEREAQAERIGARLLELAQMGAAGPTGEELRA